MSELGKFTAQEVSITSSFNNFAEWARPFGIGQFNSCHHETYDRDAPYFDWATSLTHHSETRARSWFYKQEQLGNTKLFRILRHDQAPVILDRQGLINSGPFMDFAKAYVNVMCTYRRVRGKASNIIIGLIFIEKSLRDAHGGLAIPTKINALILARAEAILLASDVNASQKYDIGKEIEIVGSMIQTGHQFGRMRAFEGFNLVHTPFAYSSNVPYRPRKREISLNAEELSTHDKRLGSEHIAAVGLAYRKSIALFGQDSAPTFFAAIGGLALTTVSMRQSDMLTLSREALYISDSRTGRRKLRITRPKNQMHQDLPIPFKLGDLAAELFQTITSSTQEASDAFVFYLKSFSTFDSIDTLYIPLRMRDLFAQKYISMADVSKIMNRPYVDVNMFSSTVYKSLDSVQFVDEFDDIHLEGRRNWKFPMCKISAVEEKCREYGISTRFPVSLDREKFIDRPTASNYVSNPFRVRKSLARIFEGGKLPKRYVLSQALQSFLLTQFKSSRFPHWPFADKDKVIRLDRALLVCHQSDLLRGVGVGENTGRWWMPGLVGANAITRWIDRDTWVGAPLLFMKTDIRLRDGTYPSIAIHDTRKYHQTNALLAGANEVFIDEQAGRSNGRQSDHYDLRSPHEILAQSIDTFDPDEDFTVVGPVAEQAKAIKLVDRKVFLYENAAPKHVTDVGGCATDWSLDPCKQYGNCMRCDQQVWRKGDQQRLLEISRREEYARKMIAVAEGKIKEYSQPPRSLVLQYEQFKDDLSRCEEIYRVEANPEIEIGTIVTFAAAPRAMSSSALTSQLRAQTLGSEKKRI